LLHKLLHKRTRTVALSYNAANRLSSHTDTAGAPPAPVTGTYAYDGYLRRVKQVVGGVTRYSVYDASGGLVSIDQVGAGPTEYIRASGMVLARVAGAAVTWLHPDHLGSAVAGTGSTGSVVWRESEQPFGEDWITAPANDNQAGYTGHVEDAATGLTYMQARYYDPVIGRFLANDPVGFSPNRPDMFNRYAYAANDPVNMVDPDGELAILAVPLICAGGACQAAAAGVATGVVIGGTYLASQNPDFALSAILHVPGAVPLIGMLNSDNQSDDRKAPPANDGMSRPHGASDHDKAIDDRAAEVRADGATDIRKNQTQVDASGNRVGDNKPDLGYNDKDGRRNNEEWGRDQDRLREQGERARRNDSDCVTKGTCLPKR
jgi:RHS repeat-associated protein